MKPTLFRLTFSDGSCRWVTCVLDPDRHTAHYLREYLADIALRERIFGHIVPELITVEEVIDSSSTASSIPPSTEKENDQHEPLRPH